MMDQLKKNNKFDVIPFGEVEKEIIEKDKMMKFIMRNSKLQKPNNLQMRNSKPHHH